MKKPFSIYFHHEYITQLSLFEESQQFYMFRYVKSDKKLDTLLFLKRYKKDARLSENGIYSVQFLGSEIFDILELVIFAHGKVRCNLYRKGITPVREFNTYDHFLEYLKTLI